MTSAVEFRVEADAEVAPHVHARGVQLLEAEPSREGEQLREALLRVLRQLLSVLCHNQARAARAHLPARPPARRRSGRLHMRLPAAGQAWLPADRTSLRPALRPAGIPWQRGRGERDAL